MPGRVRVSTTVDAESLDAARSARPRLKDAALLDEALAALVAKQRAVQIDAGYEAYETHPLDEPDEWGELDSFHRAAATS